MLMIVCGGSCSHMHLVQQNHFYLATKGVVRAVCISKSVKVYCIVLYCIVLYFHVLFF